MKTFYIFAIIVFFVELAFTQPHKQCKHKEQIKAQKVAFLTSKLDLTVQEAQSFWPLYNEYEKKKEEIFEAQNNLYEAFSKENLSEKELNQLADKYIELQFAESKLLAEYHNKFKKILPINKVVTLYSSDRMFKKELLRQLKNCPNRNE
jgi:Spy/CpxP family protein refolding chaperone